MADDPSIAIPAVVTTCCCVWVGLDTVEDDDDADDADRFKSKDRVESPDSEMSPFCASQLRLFAAKIGISAEEFKGTP